MSEPINNETQDSFFTQLVDYASSKATAVQESLGSFSPLGGSAETDALSNDEIPVSDLSDFFTSAADTLVLTKQSLLTERKMPTLAQYWSTTGGMRDHIKKQLLVPYMGERKATLLENSAEAFVHAEDGEGWSDVADYLDSEIPGFKDKTGFDESPWSLSGFYSGYQYAQRSLNLDDNGDFALNNNSLFDSDENPFQIIDKDASKETLLADVELNESSLDGDVTPLYLPFAYPQDQQPSYDYSSDESSSSSYRSSQGSSSTTGLSSDDIELISADVSDLAEKDPADNTVLAISNSSETEDTSHAIQTNLPLGDEDEASTNGTQTVVLSTSVEEIDDASDEPTQPTVTETNSDMASEVILKALQTNSVALDAPDYGDKTPSVGKSISDEGSVIFTAQDSRLASFDTQNPSNQSDTQAFDPSVPDPNYSGTKSVQTGRMIYFGSSDDSSPFAQGKLTPGQKLTQQQLAASQNQQPMPQDGFVPLHLAGQMAFSNRQAGSVGDNVDSDLLQKGHQDQLYTVSDKSHTDTGGGHSQHQDPQVYVASGDEIEEPALQDDWDGGNTVDPSDIYQNPADVFYS